VIFISHTLPYVVDVCDHIVTMRLGQVVSEYRAAGVTTDQLVSDMTGSSAAAISRQRGSRLER
jgi:simple sugar transport system ATP-binding protein